MKNILLVNDDTIVNLINTRILELSGIAGEIHTVLNGEQAITLINNYYMGVTALPDIILLDLDIPVIDKFGFLGALKRLPNQKQNMTIIVMSGSFTPDDVQQARDLGVTRFLAKPISQESLMKVLGADTFAAPG